VSALPRDFYEREAEAVARALLGTILVTRIGKEERRARIVETEAYVGEHDLACHAAKGNTPRTRVMFGRAGHAYVYLVYGMHELFNVVTGPDGVAQAVLVRAAEMDGMPARHASGPGKLARALGITREDYGRDLCAKRRVWLEPGPPPEAIAATPRIGVDYAGEWAAAPLRFIDASSHAVSGKRPRG